MEETEERKDTLGNDRDYRVLAHIKVLVDKYFGDVQVGKKHPRVAILTLKDEIENIIFNYNNN